MVLDLNSLMGREMIEEEEEPIPSPQIEVETADDRYGKFVIEPLEPGYGVTLGNPLRRVLYSGLEGTAITWVKIEGIQHEFATVPHVKEQVTEMLLNVKGIRLRSEVDRPGKLRLEVVGEGEVCAGDIMASADFEVVNPELHLATLDSSEAKLSIELNVERGKGYQVAAEGDGQAIGVLPVDAIFTPINKVSYTIERTRVGQRTDFERLVLQVWTDGSKLPVEAVRQAANILVTQFYMFANAKIDSQEGVDGLPQKYIVSAEIYNVTVERLDLPSRTLNCLKRAGIDKVGQVLEMSRAELMRIRNFGDKSYKELFGKLKEMDYLPADMEPETADDEETEAVAAE
ncbi:MAG: DNA-directed RNA polymerase subunit alpha [SAR202 cluster bacterium]|nr:DNA-directed RNA polymerase subunit alpha [SAR202 cluster bacterium]